MSALDDRIRELAEPLAEELGLYLYDVQTQRGRRLVIRLRAERKSKQGPTDGITIDECATLSRRLEHVLDLEETVPTRYALEVSSPGLERELKTVQHFEGAIGERVRVRLTRADEPTSLEGRLVEVNGDHIVLEQEATPLELPLSAIRRAETIFRG